MCSRETWGYITFKRDPSQSLLALEQPVLSTWVSSQQTPPPPHLESNHRLECTSIRAQLHCQCNIPRFVNTWPIPESLSREKPETRVWDKGISHSPPSPPQQCYISFLISFDPPATQDEADRPHRRHGKNCGAAPPGGRGRHAPEVVLMGRAMNWLSFISDWIHSLSFPKFLPRQMWHWEWSGCHRQHSRPPEFVSWARFPYIFTISCTAWRYLNISLV